MNDQPTPQVDEAVLADVVRQALRRPHAQLLSWHQQPVGYARVWSTSGGVYRLGGTARDGAHELPWSCVLKLVRSPAAAQGTRGLAGSDDPAAEGYWRREALLFRDGLLEQLPGGVAAPRCYALEEHGDGVRVWMEEIVDAAGPEWSLDDYAFAARALGRFNGAYLAGAPAPEHPALCRPTLREEVAAERAAPAIPDRVWDDPRVRAVFPEPLGERIAAAFADADRLLAAAERLPRGFVHRDAFRANLMRRRDPGGADQLVLLDWALAGPGALGEELYKMLLGSCALMHWPGGARALDAAIFPPYLAGLREAGWDADEHLVRFGYAVRALAGAAGARHPLRNLLDPESAVRSSARFGKTAAEIVAARVDLNLFLLDLVGEARATVP